jgi:PAS domain S-box
MNQFDDPSSLFEGAPVAYHEIDSTGRIRRANLAECAMLGYDPRELAGKFVWDLTAPQDREQFRASIEQKLSGAAKLEPYRGQLVRKDGSPVTIEFYENPIEDEGGSITGIRGILIDITGREEAMDFTAAILEGAGSPIVVLRPDGRMIRFNRACEQVSGYSFDELRDRPFWEALTISEEIEPLKEMFERLRRGSGPLQHEIHWRTRSGELRLIAWSNALLRDKQGSPAFIVSSGVDITGRGRAEELLRASEQRYRDLFENASDIIYTHDLDGFFTSINAAAEKIIGYTRGEVLGMNISRILSPEDSRRGIERVYGKLDGGAASTSQCDIIAKDGRRVSLEISARLQLKNGKPIGIHGVARDITDRKLAEVNLESYAGELARKNEELADALTAAKEATELKSRFLATMSHEIRTPMNGVLGMTELLMSTPLDAEQRDYAQAVRHSAEALLVVINDVLDISKIEAGKLHLERVPFDPRAVVDEVIGLLAPRAAAKGLRLTCEQATTLPRVVRGDPGRLRQILLNLIGNAVKFTEEGEVVVSTQIAGVTPEAATVQFSVRDTGIGISPEKRSRLFQSFVQGDSSTTRKYGGTGLGLAISKQLVEMMGGMIELESELGRGSTFTFLIAFEKYSPETSRAHAGGNGAFSLAGCKTLVIDETAGEGAMTQEYLTMLGCRCDLASRAEALERLRGAMAAGDPYRIVLLDLSAPEPEIFSFSRAIAGDPAIRETILICCVEPPLRGEDRLKSFGFSAALQKPVTPSVLQDTLIAAIEEAATASRG